MATSSYEISGRWTGRLRIIPRPRGGDWLNDELANLAESGVHVLVSLLESQEAAQLGLERVSEVAPIYGIELVTYPVADRSVPTSQAEWRLLVDRLQHSLQTGHTVAIHCRQSVGRAGMLAVSLLLGTGKTLETAVSEVSRARGVTVPETAEQRRWLESVAAQPVL